MHALLVSAGYASALLIIIQNRGFTVEACRRKKLKTLNDAGIEISTKFLFSTNRVFYVNIRE